MARANQADAATINAPFTPASNEDVARARAAAAAVPVKRRNLFQTFTRRAANLRAGTDSGPARLVSGGTSDNMSPRASFKHGPPGGGGGGEKYAGEDDDVRDPACVPLLEVIVDQSLEDVPSAVQHAAAHVNSSINEFMRFQSTYTAQTRRFELQRQKRDFSRFIDSLVSTLTLKANVLRLKMNSYKAWETRVQVILFCGAASISLITGFEVMYAAFQVGAQSAAAAAPLVPLAIEGNATTMVPDPNAGSDIPLTAENALRPGEVLAFSLVVFVLATIMGLITTINKFRGWKDESDAMSTIYDKANLVISDLPNTQHQIKFVTCPEELELLRTAFMAREFKLYSETLRSIGMHLSFESLTNHLPGFYALNVRNMQDEQVYEAELLSIMDQRRQLMNSFGTSAEGTSGNNVSPRS